MLSKATDSQCRAWTTCFVYYPISNTIVNLTSKVAIGNFLWAILLKSFLRLLHHSVNIDGNECLSDLRLPLHAFRG